MGITIKYKLGQKLNCVKGTLDRAQELAEAIRTQQVGKIGVPFEIRRLNDKSLRVDIGNCETLNFMFETVKEINTAGKLDWDYAHAVLTDDGKKILDEGYEIEKYPQNEKAYCAGFCKTQFSKSMIEHKWIAEIIRAVAGRCFAAEVSDEGGYYH